MHFTLRSAGYNRRDSRRRVELRFDASQSAPEPGSLALMSIATIAGLAVALYRRKARGSPVRV
jgi:PEP-CTERM motif-containing protein